MKGLKLTILFLFSFANLILSQDLEKAVIEGFNLGKADMLQLHTAEELELITPEYEGTFSKDMANKHLESFFSNCQVEKFNVVHRGNSPSGSTYFIGELHTDKGLHRVYLLYSGKQEKKISEIRIESDE